MRPAREPDDREPDAREPADDRTNGPDGSDVVPDRAEGAPSKWDPDRTGPSRDVEPAPGNVGRSEPWTETAEDPRKARSGENPRTRSADARMPRPGE